MPPDAPHADTPAPSGNSAHTAAQIVAALLVALVLYVLSIGPVTVTLYAVKLDSNSEVEKCFNIIYAPILCLGKQHPPTQKFFQSYVLWCDHIYGKMRGLL